MAAGAGDPGQPAPSGAVVGGGGVFHLQSPVPAQSPKQQPGGAAHLLQGDFGIGIVVLGGPGDQPVPELSYVFFHALILRFWL